MKKALLLIGGLGLAGYGLYRYFNYQVGQAMNYNYSIKKIRVLKIEGNNLSVSASIDITNNSSFSLLINEYDLQVFFKDIPFVSSKSNIPITISPNSIFTLNVDGIIDLKEVKTAIIPFLDSISNQKPIDIQVSGTVKIVFLGIPTTITLDKQVVNYSVDLLKDYGLDENWKKLKAQIQKAVGYIGIKL